MWLKLRSEMRMTEMIFLVTMNQIAYLKLKMEKLALKSNTHKRIMKRGLIVKMTMHGVRLPQQEELLKSPKDGLV